MAGGANLGSAHGEIFIGVASALANLRSLQAGLIATGATGTAAGAAAVAGGIAVGAMGAAIAVGLGSAINTAADFQQRISGIGAVLNSTSAEMDALRQKALDLGRDTAYTASEAASAIEELAKAGLDAGTILGGAADGAVALAAAAGSSVPDAAVIIAAALNQFALGGEQAAHVADLVAAAANTSAASVEDIGTALSYVGTAANQLNIPIEDTVTAIAALADAGIRGTRAGTNLNRALTELIAPSDKQAAKMEELGLSVTNLDGSFVGLPETIRRVDEATRDLSDTEKAAALDTLFHAEGARAMNALLLTQGEEADAAGKSWEDYSAGVNVAGAAATAAAARLDNLAGDSEKLRGSIEVLKIRIGDVFLPVLRELTQAATAVVNVLANLPGPIIAILSVMAALGSAVLIAAGAWAVFGSTIVGAIGAVGAILGGLAGLLPIILAVGAALAVLGLAWKSNLGGAPEAVSEFVGAFANLPGLSDDFKEFFENAGDTKNIDKNSESLRENRHALRDLIAEALGFETKKEAFGATYDPMAGGFIGGQKQQKGDTKFLKELDSRLKTTAKEARAWSNKIEIAGRAWGDFKDIMGGDTSNMEKFKDRLGDVFGEEVGDKVFDTTMKLRRGFMELNSALSERFGIENLLSVRGAALLALDAFNGLSEWARTSLVPAFGEALVALGNLGAAFFDLGEAIVQGDIPGAVDAVVEILRVAFSEMVIPVAGFIVEIGKGVLRWAAGAAWDIAKELWAFVFGNGQAYSSSGDGTQQAESGDIVADGVVGWAINVGVPELVGWVKDGATSLADLLWTAVMGGGGASGFPGMGGSANGSMVQTEGLLSWSINTAAPELVGWVEGGVSALASLIAEKVLGGTGSHPAAGTGIGGGGTSGGGIHIPGAVDWVVETLEPKLTGWIIGGATALAALIKTKIVAGAGLIIPLGQILLDGTLALGGSLLAAAASLTMTIATRLKAGWDALVDLGPILLDGALILGGALLSAAAAIGTTIAQKLKSGWDSLVDLGTIMLDGSIDLGGSLLGASGSIATELASRLKSGWDGIVDLGPVLLDGAISTGGDLLAATTDMSAALATKLTAGWDKTVDIGTVIVKATLDLADDIDYGSLVTSISNGAAAAVTASADFGTSISTAIKDKVKGITDWDITGEDMFNAGTAFGSALRTAIFETPIDIGMAIGDFLEKAVTSIKPGDIDFKAIGPTAAASLVAGFAVDNADSFAKIAGGISAFIGGALVGFVLGEDVTFDEVTTAIGERLQSALESAPAAVSSVINFGEFIGKLLGFGPGGTASDFPGMGGSARGGSDLGGMISDKVVQPMIDLILDIPDLIGAGVGEIADIKLPSLSFDTSTLTAAFDTLKQEIIDAAPSWVKKFFSGDVSGAFKDILGIGGSDGGTTIPINSAGDGIPMGLKIDPVLELADGATARGAVEKFFTGFLSDDAGGDGHKVDIPILPDFILGEGADPAASIESMLTTFKTTGDGTEEASSGLNIDIPINPSFKLAEEADLDVSVGSLFSGGEEAGGDVAGIDVTIPVNPTVILAEGADVSGQIATLLGGIGAGGGASGFPGMGGSATGGGAAGISVTLPVNPTVVLAEGADIAGQIQTLLGGLGAEGGAGTNITVTATFTADIGAVATAYTNVYSWGTIWDAAVFTGDFNGNNGGAAIAYTEAFGWGDVWDGQEFIADFNGDPSGALSAASAAQSAGDGWAGQVFTASFSIDTSGLATAVAAARAAAAAIAAVLPHSPAKEGPLREPISFMHVADAFKAAADRMIPMATVTAGSIVSAFEDSDAALYSRLAGIKTPTERARARVARDKEMVKHVSVFAIHPDQWVEYADKADQGAEARYWIDQAHRK